MSIKIIGDLLINEYSQDNYDIRVTTVRKTAELLSVILSIDAQVTMEDGNVSESLVQVYYGKTAKELYFELLAAKLNKHLGIDSKLDLREFFNKGTIIKSSQENN